MPALIGCGFQWKEKNWESFHNPDSRRVTVYDKRVSAITKLFAILDRRACRSLFSSKLGWPFDLVSLFGLAPDYQNSREIQVYWIPVACAQETCLSKLK
jgi:hypothetical protein